MSFDLIMEQIQLGRSVKDHQLLVADEAGWTVAHVLAATRVFPVDFPYWDLRDNKGYTVAHQAAFHKKLPEGFNMWLLVDEDMNSVAHVAARNGTFPFKYQNDRNVFFKHTNNKGVSVKDEVRQYGLDRLADLKAILRS